MIWRRYKALLLHTPCPETWPALMATSVFRCQLHAHHKGGHVFMAYLRSSLL
jgi:hypothetical protein